MPTWLTSSNKSSYLTTNNIMRQSLKIYIQMFTYKILEHSKLWHLQYKLTLISTFILLKLKNAKQQFWTMWLIDWGVPFYYAAAR